ncbi:MAG: hypothetical protein R3Y32_05160 [Bacillota bacterium]
MGILSSIGDWMEEKYNNLTTAVSITTTPSTYITGTGGYTTPTVNSNGISSDITASVGSSATSSSTASSIYQTAEDKFEAEVEEIYALDDDKDTSSNSSSSTTQTPSSYITGSNLTASDTGYNGISTDMQTSSDYDAIKWVQTVIENIQKALNTMQYTDYEDNALENDGVLGDKTISAWNEFIEDKGVTNYLGSVYNYVNPSTTTTSNLYGALDYSSNYADNLDFSINKNYTGKVSSYLENQGYINPSSVETNTAYEHAPYVQQNTVNNIEDLENIVGGVSLFGNALSKTANFNELSELLNYSQEFYNKASVGGKTISYLGTIIDIASIVEDIVDGDMRSATVSVGSIAGAIPGVAIGALAGVGLGPIGIIAGGTMGGIAGGAIVGNLAGYAYDFLNK